MSVPDPADLPESDLPGEIARTYPEGASPVFFGHYWMTGAPVVQAPNAMCLDYSAGVDGPLVTYEWRSGDREILPERVKVHGAVKAV